MYSQGRRNRTFTTPDGLLIVLSYGFIKLFWVFAFTYGYRYAVATELADGSVNHKQISKEEAAELNGGKAVAPPVMERFSFLIFLGILAAVIAYRLLTSA